MPHTRVPRYLGRAFKQMGLKEMGLQEMGLQMGLQEINCKKWFGFLAGSPISCKKWVLQGMGGHFVTEIGVFYGVILDSHFISTVSGPKLL